LSTHLKEDKPIFIQIAEIIEDAILSGVYAEETQVPSITEMALVYKINPATALKGVNMLVDSGLLYKKRGLGMYVAQDARMRIIGQRKEQFHHKYIKPMLAEAKSLGISHAEICQMIERGDQENGD